VGVLCAHRPGTTAQCAIFHAPEGPNFPVTAMDCAPKAPQATVSACVTMGGVLLTAGDRATAGRSILALVTERASRGLVNAFVTHFSGQLIAASVARVLHSLALVTGRATMAP